MYILAIETTGPIGSVAAAEVPESGKVPDSIAGGDKAAGTEMPRIPN